MTIYNILLDAWEIERPRSQTKQLNEWKMENHEVFDKLADYQRNDTKARR